MLDWRKALDAMKAEAKRKEADAPPAPIGRKWCEDGKYFYASPQSEVEKLQDWQTARIVKGWHLILTLGPIDENARVWWLSASTYPSGREPNDKDRKWLKSLVTHLGAVFEDSFVTAPEHTHNPPLHWTWAYDGAN